MKKLKFLFILLIPLIITLNISDNTSAYTFFSNFNITAFTYKPDSTNNAAITKNSINSYASTPLVSDAFTGTYHAILAPKFTLNKDANLSRSQRFLLKFELNLRLDEDMYNNQYPNMVFICPYGYDQLRVAECRIYGSDWEPILFTGQGGTQYAVDNHKNYIVEIELYHNSDTPQAYRDLQLAGRLFSVTINSTNSNILNYFTWQLTWVQSSAFYYTDPNGAAEALEEQNRKDDQDRSNINDQQEENDSEASNQEEEANETGQTLMGAFSSLITALGNVHTTNCKLPNMSVYSIELKNMDLCTVNMPSGVSALAGIAMSLIIIKMGYSLVKRMLNLYKEIIG